MNLENIMYMHAFFSCLYNVSIAWYDKFNLGHDKKVKIAQ